MFLFCELILFSYLFFYIIFQIVTIFNKNITTWYFSVEDIIILELSSLSFILIVLKLLYFRLELQVFFYIITSLIIVASLIELIIILAYPKKNKLHKFNDLNLKLPKLNHFLLFSTIFSLYLIRALLKAKNFNDFIYIPSRYNTDIFLYLRRISVFLGKNTAFTHQYDGINAIDIVYDSPKLLSSLVYAIFTDIFHHPGIAGTILTSIILTAIICKYILAIKNYDSFPQLLYITIVVFLFFQPSLSWLQDQFYLSNLLYIYLLIYTVEDFLFKKELDSKIFLKLTTSAIAVAGFYPSQLPFLALATIVLLFLTNQSLSNKVVNTLKTFVITIAISLIFRSQYLATSEVTQHFNLADSKHGVNFIYIPFWSILNLVPKSGGFKVTFDSVTLVIVSIFLAILTTRYLAKKLSFIAQYLYLSLFLYIPYSLSFIFFPGSYRQGKFFVTYIIPLILFCFIKIIQEPKISRKPLITGMMLILAVYVAWNSLDRQYKSHFPQNIQQQISYLPIKYRAISVYYDNASEHRYYYFSYQFKDYPLKMISHCPSATELEKDRQLNRIAVITDTCDIGNIDLTNDNVIQLSL